MSRPKNKTEFRQQLAEAFANVLDEKGLEWKQEWQGKGGSAPHNGVTKACYRGVNAFWLSLLSMVKGYDDPRWVTMIQIMDRDGKYHPKEKWHLKAGTKATYVEYWFPYDVKAHKALTWEQYKAELDNGRKADEFTLSTRYTAVFNACNVEGIPALEKPEGTRFQADRIVEKLSENMNVPILCDGGSRAFYSITQDRIHLPSKESFDSEYAFNSTALHELAHSTSHPDRLNRIQSGIFGTPEYAYEELVAEISSCFMGADLEVAAAPEHIENHKAYVQSWIAAIRDKPDTLVKAIKDAQETANYMDWKAELISEKEYAELKGAAIEFPVRSAPSRDCER